MNITTRDIADLTQQEQDRLRHWRSDILVREAAHKRMQVVQQEREIVEGRYTNEQ